jgi:hypothetical protein
MFSTFGAPPTEDILNEAEQSKLELTREIVSAVVLMFDIHHR